MRLAKCLVLILSLALLSACSTRVPATVTRHPIGPLKKGGTLYVVATAQRARIVESLRTAGLRTSDQWPEASYALEVKVGNSRGSRECGTINNVRYDLRSGGQVVLVMKGRGPTGGCPDNIFDEMSQSLATYL